MTARLTKLRALSWSEWRLLGTAMVMLPFTALSLHLFGFQRTRDLMSRSIPASNAVELTKENKRKQATITARMVSAAAHHGPYRANCLKQSLVLWWLLQRRGIQADLRIGVKKEEMQLDAHSWIELDGQVLIGGEHADKQYARLI